MHAHYAHTHVYEQIIFLHKIRWIKKDTSDAGITRIHTHTRIRTCDIQQNIKVYVMRD